MGSRTRSATAAANRSASSRCSSRRRTSRRTRSMTRRRRGSTSRSRSRFSSNDTDPDFDELHVVSATSSRHTGPSTARTTATAATRPQAGYTGPDSFTYMMTDGISTDGATVSITVTPNAPPDAADDTATTKHDKPVTIAVLANDTDPDGDEFAIIAHSSRGPRDGRLRARVLHLHAGARVRRRGHLHVHGQRRTRRLERVGGGDGDTQYAAGRRGRPRECDPRCAGVDLRREQRRGR